MATESVLREEVAAPPRKVPSGTDIRQKAKRSDQVAEQAAFASLSFVHPKHGGTYGEKGLWALPKLPRDATITEVYHVGRLIALELLSHCKRYRADSRIPQVIRALLQEERIHPKQGAAVRSGVLEVLWDALNLGVRHVNLDAMCAELDADAEELSARLAKREVLQ